MQQEKTRSMIEVYGANITEIKKIMDDKNRSSAYVANVLIEEALVNRGILKGGKLKL